VPLSGLEFLEITEGRYLVSIARDKVVQACSEALPAEALEGLSGLGLSDEDFFAAVYAELLDHGVDDPDAFLREKGIID
jgi:hypothetical protein